MMTSGVLAACGAEDVMAVLDSVVLSGDMVGFDKE